ncbi:DUF4157 domain-containing protein [Sorangium atrum]|uniref:DUF4157 domain-containing protein n=1 Tax=Sorangium atrum TaxID=2995308 RepID=A0ABT5BQU0_9BACT|nr:DUF4157 domain-containing protein [Sorangium aterium]MDC0676528.1 DUF4157 domain-containing protein [Sorangium aterium]
MQIAVDRSTPKTSQSATRTSRARPPAPPLVQRRTTPPARPPAESARAALERAFGAEFVAAAATGRTRAVGDRVTQESPGAPGGSAIQAKAAGPGVGTGSGPDRAVNSTGIPSPVKAKMEAAFGTDFSGVRVHPRSSRATALGALAYTQGSEIHVAPGRWAPETRQGQELLGHELAHVVQQRAGRVQATAQYKGIALNDAPALEAEADVMGAKAARGESCGGQQTPSAPPSASSRPDGQQAAVQCATGVIQRRNSAFNPFHQNQANYQGPRFRGLQLDVLIENGLVYPGGGTSGNAVNLEKMVSNTGGGSSPGAPLDFEEIRLIDAGLVRANNQQNAATAMHAINHNFAPHAQTNNRAENIFMGSAKSNTQLHYNLVENPIRQSMQRATSGNALKYETNLVANPPFQFQPPGSASSLLAWNNSALDIPGAKPTTQYPGVTHFLDETTLNNVSLPWPKVITYTVVPNYTYKRHPHLPAFLMGNIQYGDNLITQEQQKPPKQQDTQAIQNEQAGIALLRAVGHRLFPETFTCSAVYWFPTYNHARPWRTTVNQDDYDAEY